MRKFLLLSSFVFTTYLASAQAWLVQSSNWPNTSEGVYDFSVPSENVAWAISYDGTVQNRNFIDFIRTTDGGATWGTNGTGTVGTDTNYKFSNISAIDGNNAYVAMFNKSTTPGGGGLILHTTNGGQNWTSVSSGLFNTTGAFLNFVHFWDANNGIAMGDPTGSPKFFEIHTTTDGGANWTRVPTSDIPLPNSATEYGTINFFTTVGDHIWFWTTTGRVFHSADKGLHWTASTVLAMTTGSMNVRFKDANYGLAQIISATTNLMTALYVTHDGGASWTIVNPIPTQFHHGDFLYIPNTNMWLSAGVKYTAPADTGSSWSVDPENSWTEFDPGVQHYKLGSFSLTATYNGGFAPVGGLGGIYKYNGTNVGVPNTVSLLETPSYPNPSSGQITINVKVGNKDVNVLLVDAMGRVVYDQTYSGNGILFNKTFDFSSFAKGVYTIVMTAGTDRSQEKIVIQ